MTAAKRLAEIRRLASAIVRCRLCKVELVEHPHAKDALKKIYRLSAPKPASPKGRKR